MTPEAQKPDLPASFTRLAGLTFASRIGVKIEPEPGCWVEVRCQRTDVLNNIHFKSLDSMCMCIYIYVTYIFIL